MTKTDLFDVVVCVCPSCKKKLSKGYFREERLFEFIENSRTNDILEKLGNTTKTRLRKSTRTYIKDKTGFALCAQCKTLIAKLSPMQMATLATMINEDNYKLDESRTIDAVCRHIESWKTNHPEKLEKINTQVFINAL